MNGAKRMTAELQSASLPKEPPTAHRDGALSQHGEATLEVRPEELFALIGEQHVEIKLLRARVAQLSAQLSAMVAARSAEAPG